MWVQIVKPKKIVAQQFHLNYYRLQEFSSETKTLSVQMSCDKRASKKKTYIYYTKPSKRQPCRVNPHLKYKSKFKFSKYEQ